MKFLCLKSYKNKYKSIDINQFNKNYLNYIVLYYFNCKNFNPLKLLSKIKK